MAVTSGIETESFLVGREPSADPVENRARLAETMCYDLIRMTFGQLSIMRSMLFLLRRESPTFVADLELELQRVADRLDSMVNALLEETRRGG